MRKQIRFLLVPALILTSLFTLTFSVSAQWPTNVQENLAVSDVTGEQTTPKVVAASDGGCFVSWMDFSGGNYNTMLQRYDADGVAQWAENGLVVSSHPQNSWITDYDVLVDWDNNVYVALNDVRHATGEVTEANWDIFIYKIAPDGTFLWGDNGLTLSDNGVIDVAPRLLLTWDGNIVAAWERGNGAEDEIFSVVIHKLDSDGNSLWDPVEREVPGGRNMARPVPVPADMDGFYLQYLLGDVGQRTIHMQSFDAEGSALWATPAQLCPESDIPVWSAPKAVADNANGVYSVWYQAVGPVTSRVFAQHVDEDGNPLWGDAGMRVSTAEGFHEFSPEAVGIMLMGGSGLMVFYGGTDGITPTGVLGQYIQSDGTRAWGDEARRLILGTSTHEVSGIAADRFGWSNALCSYLWLNSQNMNDVQVRAFQVDLTGNFVWPDTSVVLSSVLGDKGNLHLSSLGDRAVAVWKDGRHGMWTNPDIYLHSVTTDGSTGGMQLLVGSPTEGAGYRELPIFAEPVVRGIELGSEGYLRVSITAEGQDGMTVDFDNTWVMLDSLYTGVNTLEFSLVDLDLVPFDPPVSTTLNICYTPDAQVVIQSPDQDAIINHLPMLMEVGLNGFEIGAHGSLMIRSEVDGNVVWTGTTQEEIFEVPQLAAGENLLFVTLLGLDGQPVIPVLEDSVTVLYAPTSVDERETMPVSFALHPARPNPFNAETVIRFDVARRQPVRLSVYDLLGREVACLTDGPREAGVHEVVFSGTGLASGTYFYRMTSAGFTSTRRMVLVK